MRVRRWEQATLMLVAVMVMPQAGLAAPAPSVAGQRVIHEAGRAAPGLLRAAVNNLPPAPPTAFVSLGLSPDTSNGTSPNKVKKALVIAAGLAVTAGGIYLAATGETTMEDCRYVGHGYEACTPTADSRRTVGALGALGGGLLLVWGLTM